MGCIALSLHWCARFLDEMAKPSVTGHQPRRQYSAGRPERDLTEESWESRLQERRLQGPALKQRFMGLRRKQNHPVMLDSYASDARLCLKFNFSCLPENSVPYLG